MKLHYLKYFCVLAEELHFHRAASRLAISQPPLSAAIKCIEEELGAQLLLRNSKMVQLTPAGQAFLVEAREILERVDRVRGIVRAVDEGVHARLDIGMAGSLMYREVPDILARFRCEAPHVDVVLHELATVEQIDKLLRKQLHAAFVHGAVMPPQLAALPLRDDVFVLCMPEDHPHAGDAEVDLRHLAHEPFVMFSREGAPANHDNVIAIFSRAGFHPRTVHRARVWLTIVAMVAQGSGVALVPRSLANARVAGVRFVPFKGETTIAPARLAWNPDGAPPALLRFLETATHTIRRPGKAAIEV
ncbi:LysR family transcriptional regulator [Xylophilus sp. GW821-FHT01B05]